MKIQDYQKGKDPRHTISRITKAYRGEEEWILHAVGDEDKKDSVPLRRREFHDLVC